MPMTEDQPKWLAQAFAACAGPNPGEIYRHYKGDLYVIVCCSVKEDTYEHLVTYRSNARGSIWTRTLVSFTETVSHAADNPSGPCPRFRRVDEDD